MKCPVCLNDLVGHEGSCEVCGFSDLHQTFINVEEAENWISSVVSDYRKAFIKTITIPSALPVDSQIEVIKNGVSYNLPFAFLKYCPASKFPSDYLSCTMKFFSYAEFQYGEDSPSKIVQFAASGERVQIKGTDVLILSYMANKNDTYSEDERSSIADVVDQIRYEFKHTYLQEKEWNFHVGGSRLWYLLSIWLFPSAKFTNPTFEHELQTMTNQDFVSISDEWYGVPFSLSVRFWEIEGVEPKINLSGYVSEELSDGLNSIFCSQAIKEIFQKHISEDEYNEIFGV